MRTDAAPKPTLLEDYAVPDFIFDHVDLDFNLTPKATTVKSKLMVKRNPAGKRGLISFLTVKILPFEV